MKNSKWPLPQAMGERKQEQAYFREVKEGRYRRTVQKHGRYKATITESIMDYDLTIDLWSISFTLERNHFDLYLKAYNNSPPLNQQHQIFECWD